jgi:hypothetical protein
MNKDFVDCFMENKSELRALFATGHPQNYGDIVKAVVDILDPGVIDPDRIHEIDDGDYQGTLVFVIGAHGYLPVDYWYVKISYGCCSGCDTLESIRSVCPYEENPTEEQIADYMTLALHIVQGLKKMGDDIV